MKRRIGQKFYLKPTLQVAQELLGKHIVRKFGKKTLVGKIVETEAYIGKKDKASHAYLGKRTARNEVEYLEGGRIYIYLCYGMHWQLNFTTAKEGSPECVLIRALEPILENKNLKEIRNLANGPGKLCRWLKLDKSFYGEDLAKSERIWLQDPGDKIKKDRIKSSKRIGIDYAGFWAKKPWRFYLKDSDFVSVK